METQPTEAPPPKIFTIEGYTINVSYIDPKSTSIYFQMKKRETDQSDRQILDDEEEEGEDIGEDLGDDEEEEERPRRRSRRTEEDDPADAQADALVNAILGVTTTRVPPLDPSEDIPEDIPPYTPPENEEEEFSTEQRDPYDEYGSRDEEVVQNNGKEEEDIDVESVQPEAQPEVQQEVQQETEDPLMNETEEGEEGEFSGPTEMSEDETTIATEQEPEQEPQQEPQQENVEELEDVEIVPLVKERGSKRRRKSKRKEKREKKEKKKREKKEKEEKKKEAKPKKKRELKLTACDEEIKITGELCAAIISPHLMCRLRVTYSPASGHTLVSIVSVSSKMPVTPAIIRRAVNKTSFYGPITEPVKVRSERFKKELGPILQKLGLEWGDELSSEHIKTLENVSSKRIQNIFRNIDRTPEFFQMVNLIGADLSSKLCNEEIALLLGTAQADTDDRRIELFERLSMMHEFTDSQVIPFAPMDPHKLGIFWNKHDAYKIVHSLATGKKRYKNPIYREQPSCLWPPGVVAELEALDHFIYVGTDQHTRNRFVQYVQDHRSEEMLAESLIKCGKILIGDCPIDTIIKGANNYFSRIKQHILDTKKTIVVITSLNRRKNFVSSNLFTGQDKIQVILPSEAKRPNADDNNAAPKKPTAPPVLKKTGSSTGSFTLFDNLFKKASTGILLIIDRAHLLPVQEMNRIANIYGGQDTDIILIGSSLCDPTDDGYWFRDLSEMADDDKFSVSRGVIESPFRVCKSMILGYHPSFIKAMESISFAGAITVVVCDYKKKMEYKNILKDKKEIELFTIQELSYERVPTAFTILDIKEARPRDIYKIFQCTSVKDNTLVIVGNQKDCDGIMKSNDRRNIGNLGSVIKAMANDRITKMLE